MKTYEQLLNENNIERLDEAESMVKYDLDVDDAMMKKIEKAFKNSKHPFAERGKVNARAKTIEIPKQFTKGNQPFDFIDSVVDFPNMTNFTVRFKEILITESLDEEKTINGMTIKELIKSREDAIKNADRLIKNAKSNNNPDKNIIKGLEDAKKKAEMELKKLRSMK